MKSSIKKPSCELGFDDVTYISEDNSITPQSFSRHIRWEFLEEKDIQAARSSEVFFPVDALPDVIKYAVLESVDFNQCPIFITRMNSASFFYVLLVLIM